MESDIETLGRVASLVVLAGSGLLLLVHAVRDHRRASPPTDKPLTRPAAD